jgi:hypothetical protein
MLTSGVGKQTPISTYREFASTGQCVGLAVDGSSNIYITLTIANKIGKVTYPGAVVTDFAGSGTPSNQDGNGASASFNSPGPLAIDSTVNSNLYVGDTGNGTVRKIVTIASSGKAVGDVTTISFSVPGITALAVSSDGSNMIAVSSNTYPYYYVAGVDIGKATNAANAATYGVACRPGNLFYRFPTGGSGSIPALLEVSATVGSTSVNTASPVSLSQISGFLSNVTLSPSTYNGNTFVSGTVVTLSGFSLADLNGITPTLGNGTNSGTIQFTYTFSRTLSTSVSSTGTVSAPIPVETQSVVSVGGTGVGALIRNVVFTSSTNLFIQFISANSQSAISYTLSGSAAGSNLAAVSNTASGSTSNTMCNFYVKNTTLPELLYTTNGCNVGLYAKQY